MFSCDHCGDVITENRNLTRHIVSAHERKEYECDQCDNAANRKDNLNRHMMAKHRRIDDWGDGDITASDVGAEKEKNTSLRRRIS